jgi:hypothetical protein
MKYEVMPLSTPTRVDRCGARPIADLRRAASEDEQDVGIRRIPAQRELGDAHRFLRAIEVEQIVGGCFEHAVRGGGVPPERVGQRRDVRAQRILVPAESAPTSMALKAAPRSRTW